MASIIDVSFNPKFVKKPLTVLIGLIVALQAVILALLLKLNSGDHPPIILITLICILMLVAAGVVFMVFKYPKQFMGIKGEKITILDQEIYFSKDVVQEIEEKISRSAQEMSEAKFVFRALPYVNFRDSEAYTRQLGIICQLFSLNSNNIRNIAMYKLLGCYHFSFDNLGISEEYFLKAQELDKTDSMTLNALGTIKMKKEEYNSAEEYFNELIRHEKDIGWGYIGLGIVENIHKNEEKSISYFNKAKEDFSRCYSANVYDYTSLFGLALANHYLGDYQAEESILDELIKHKRVSPAFYNRAIVKMHRRAPKEAVIADLRTSLRLDREFAKRARKDAVFSPLLEDRCFKCLTDPF